MKASKLKVALLRFLRGDRKGLSTTRLVAPLVYFIHDNLLFLVVVVILDLVLVFLGLLVVVDLVGAVGGLDLASLAAAAAAGRPLERRAVRRDEVLPEVPLVLDDLLADLAGDALALDVDVDGVLLQVERVREGLPAVRADAGLHAAPAVARVAAHAEGLLLLLLSVRCRVQDR